MLSKGVDLIVANEVGGQNSAFGNDENTLNVIDRSGVVTMGPDLKSRLAEQLIDDISSRFNAQGAVQNSR